MVLTAFNKIRFSASTRRAKQVQRASINTAYRPSLLVHPSSTHRLLAQLSPQATTTPYPHLPPMAPKPASTAGKAPASTASKAPAKTTSEGTAKTAKKTAKGASSSGGDGEKKKRKKSRKETYSSYIYKGKLVL